MTYEDASSGPGRTRQRLSSTHTEPMPKIFSIQERSLELLDSLRTDALLQNVRACKDAACDHSATNTC